MERARIELGQWQQQLREIAIEVDAPGFRQGQRSPETALGEARHHVARLPQRA